jgi:ubiquinone/menaquinone biosynthesis C-methylase UbiE
MTNDNPNPRVCDYEGSDYQETFWDHGQRAYEDGAEEVALRRLLPKGGDLLLEIGAGAGRNTPRYQGYKKIVLLDYSATQLQRAQERLGTSDRYVYVAADAYKLPFVDGLFDSATMIRVLHHMVDGPRVLDQVRRVLRPDAIFILEYANKLNLKSIFRYLLRRQAWNPFSPEPVEFVELNLNFHPKTTRTWLTQAGFQVERQLTVSHFRIALLKKVIPTRLLIAADALAQLTGDLWQLSPSVFTRNRADGEHPPAEAGEGFFQCPACGCRDLAAGKDSLDCPDCRRRWPVQNGIYDFKTPIE